MLITTETTIYCNDATAIVLHGGDTCGGGGKHTVDCGGGDTYYKQVGVGSHRNESDIRHPFCDYRVERCVQLVPDLHLYISYTQCRPLLGKFPELTPH